jgi:hypothetical protein
MRLEVACDNLAQRSIKQRIVATVGLPAMLFQLD